MAIRHIPFVAALTVGAVLAGDGSVKQVEARGPVLGWVAAGSPAVLRAISGVPGAVVLSDPIALPDDAGKLAIAPGQSFGLLERTAGAEASLVRLSSGGLVSVAGVMPRWDRAVFSASGLTVALLGAGKLQVVGNLAAQPDLRRTIDVDAAPDASVTALAVDDDGRIAIGVSDGSNGSIWLATAEEGMRWLSKAGNPSALQFLPGGTDLVAGDKGSRQITILRDEPRVIATEGDGVVAPADIQVNASGRTVWIADAGANALLSVDLGSGKITTTPSSYTPVGLQRLAGGAAFLVCSSGGDEAGVWTPQGTNTQVWRLPAAKLE